MFKIDISSKIKHIFFVCNCSLNNRIISITGDIKNDNNIKGRIKWYKLELDYWWSESNIPDVTSNIEFHTLHVHKNILEQLIGSVENMQQSGINVSPVECWKQMKVFNLLPYSFNVWWALQYLTEFRS